MPKVTAYALEKKTSKPQHEWRNVGKFEVPIDRPLEGEYVRYDGIDWEIMNVIHNVDEQCIDIVVAAHGVLENLGVDDNGIYQGRAYKEEVNKGVVPRYAFDDLKE